MPKASKPKKTIFKQKKVATVCYYTQTKSKPDYKDVLVLKRFLTEREKILHKNFTSLTAHNQRLFSKAVKQARFMALLPYTDKHAL